MHFLPIEDRLKRIKTITTLISLALLYVWTMALGYWSPQFETEEKTEKGLAWFQLNGRTDGSVHLAPDHYSRAVSESQPSTKDIFPFTPTLAWLQDVCFSSGTHKLLYFADKTNSRVAQQIAKLLYPFHFFF